MDSQLDIDVRKAKALGLSYGYYKAQQYDPSADSAIQKKEAENLCPVCGRAIIPPRIKTCSIECARIRTRELHRQRYRNLVASKNGNA